MKKIVLIIVLLVSSLLSEVHSLNNTSAISIGDELYASLPEMMTSLDILKNSYKVNLLIKEKQFLLEAKKNELSLIFSLLIISIITVFAFIFYLSFKNKKISNLYE
ncbi:hypothetical protein KO500_14740 [Cellulophaga baltica]|uniref:hypothetical protein n=1 Tax=Cellulophaga TaxID=104264 RepID=UPI001C07BBAC|nr:MULTISPECIES: hypothetical protein [Cellulophaga]MBU2997704.1 hypothetical protein [Cellulophaga baltica]MDO6769099.1 hypothetical protein [Cellulophaga sp. 1_MG-2023]